MPPTSIFTQSLFVLVLAFVSSVLSIPTSDLDSLGFKPRAENVGYLPYKRAFMGMRGKKSDPTLENNEEKRAFMGMRGKKSDSLLEDLSDEDALEVLALINGLYRNKKSNELTEDYVLPEKRAAAAGNNWNVWGRRKQGFFPAKYIPKMRRAGNSGFVGMRG